MELPCPSGKEWACQMADHLHPATCASAPQSAAAWPVAVVLSGAAPLPVRAAASTPVVLATLAVAWVADPAAQCHELTPPHASTSASIEPDACPSLPPPRQQPCDRAQLQSR